MSVDEPVYFPFEDLSLAGVLTSPDSSNGWGVVIAWGSGTYPSSGRNRIRARVATELANAGFHALRFDYPGVGESQGRYRPPRLDRPYAAEIAAASRWLSNRPVDRIAVLANCFGGWSTLVSASDIPRLAAVVTVNAPVGRDHDQVVAREESVEWWVHNLRGFDVRKLRDPHRRLQYRRMILSRLGLSRFTHRATPRFEDAIGRLVDEKVPALLIYGADHFLDDFKAALASGLQKGVDSLVPPSRVVVLESPLAGYSSLPAQDVLFEYAVPWLTSLATEGVNVD